MSISGTLIDTLESPIVLSCVNFHNAISIINQVSQFFMSKLEDSKAQKHKT